MLEGKSIWCWEVWLRGVGIQKKSSASPVERERRILYIHAFGRSGLEGEDGAEISFGCFGLKSNLKFAVA